MRPHPVTGKSGPTAKQAKFLLLLDRLEALFGGAAGGGKSDALLMAAAMFFDVPGYAAIIFRRSFADLTKPKALIARSLEWWSGSKARWDGVNHTWHFPSGATLTFSFLENDRDVFHHQSAEYQFEGFDELTQFTLFQYTYMISRLRRLQAANFIPLRARGATNPPTKANGVVHGEWVKQYFLPWFVCGSCGAKVQTENLQLEQCPKCGQRGHVEFNCDPETREERIFIPSKLDDNPFLDQEAYIRSLQRLDPVTREQLRNGNWAINPKGNKFERGWFKLVDDYPRDSIGCRFWDKAGTEPAPGKDPDWTAGVRVALKNGQYFIVDLVHFQGDPKLNEDTIKQTADVDGKGVKVFMEQEPGQSGVSDVDHYAREVLVGYAFQGIRSTGNKELYANPVAAAAANGNIFVVKGSWNQEFLDEFEAFPQGPHDDIVDATSKACNALISNRRPKAGSA